ncbi:AraC family transcriptional regulator [Cohnella zeiphila]|nr:AraC family transcriptional regulator [Cohnella zeiphila]
MMFPDVKTTLNLFGIHRRKVAGDWSYPPHEHPQYEINYLLEGHQTMRVNGMEYDQRAGDLLLLRPGDVHSSRSGDGQPFEYFCIHFDLDDRLFLSLLGRMEQTLFPAASPIARKIRPALGKMMEPDSAANARSVAGRMRLQSTVFELLAQLWDAVSAETLQLSPQSYGKVELAHEIAGRLQGLANQTFRKGKSGEEPYGIREIAAALGISVSYCNRIFREVYGQSPRAYWSELMLHEACHLLSDPRYTVQTISAILGYRDIAHFSRQFKRWTGAAPSDYRKQHSRLE